MIHIAKPTKQQLLWQDMELGVIIHYCMEIYNPDFKEYKTAKVRTELSPDIINPKAFAENISESEVTLFSQGFAKCFVVRKDITDGQHICEFVLYADKKEIYRSNCVGHKRIIPLESLNASSAKEFTFKITETAGDAKIRDAAIY